MFLKVLYNKVTERKNIEYIKKSWYVNKGEKIMNKKTSLLDQLFKEKKKRGNCCSLEIEEVKEECFIAQMINKILIV